MTNAQTHLKLAYLHLDYGEWDEALTACELAAEEAEDHFLPNTLKGAILTARGEFKDAIKLLRNVARKHSDRALPQIYLAEALFLSGAKPQGQRQLEQASARHDAAEYHDMLTLLESAFIDDQP